MVIDAYNHQNANMLKWKWLQLILAQVETTILQSHGMDNPLRVCHWMVMMMHSVRFPRLLPSLVGVYVSLFPDTV